MTETIIPGLPLKVLSKALFLVLLSATVGLAAGPTPVLLIPPDARGHSDLEVWESTFHQLLKYQLQNASTVRLLPESAVDYSFRETKIDRKRELTDKDVQQLAASVSARVVLTGTFEKDLGWTLKLQVWRPRTGKSAEIVTVSCTNLSWVVCLAVQDVLNAIGAMPAANEKSKMLQFVTKSSEAVELLRRAGSELEGGTISNAVVALQRAVSLDPKFLPARNLLAYCLVMQDSADEARVLAQGTVAANPESAPAHLVLGFTCSTSGLHTTAREEFVEAARLCPSDIEAYTRLAELYSGEKDQTEAVRILKKAEALAPYDAGIHAFLGLAYARLHREKEAAAELKFAESTALDSDLGARQSLAYGYDTLHDIPHAIESYESLLSLASERGMQRDEIRNARNRVKYLKSRLTPQSFAVPRPEDFSSDKLEKFLRGRLTPDECGRVKCPLVITDEIKASAQKITSTSTNELEKARLIFSWMTNRVAGDGPINPRPSDVVFKALNNSTANLHCQDYTYLYIAFARAVGLTSYAAVVRVDYAGRVVSHICPAVFVGDRAFLVDPAYGWFGVPHRLFEVKDDVSVISAFMAQLEDQADEDVGLKLAANWPLPYFLAFGNKLNRNCTDKAFEVLRNVLKLRDIGVYEPYAEALLAEHEKRWESASSSWRKCLELLPELNEAHFGLAKALEAQQKYREAREQWQLYLRGDAKPENGAYARHAIAKIDSASD